MGFLHFWAIGIGTLALAAPIAVHFLTKPKPLARPLSTIRFLQEVIEQRKARSRFRDWLILFLRTLCIALLALALARPLLDQQPAVPLEPSRDTQRVLVIDSSQSMSAGSGGVTGWSAAQASALEYLDGGSGLQAAVIFAGARARPVFDRMSPNLNSLREAIRQAKPSAERADARAAIEQAARILESGTGAKKELVIISDFQRANWGTMLLDLVPESTQVQFHSVAPKNTDNVAITAARFTSEPIIGQSTGLDIEISNFSNHEVDVRCVLDMTDARRTITSKLAAQSTRNLTELITFNEAGWKHGWVRLESNLDVLPNDDERPLAIRVRPPVHALMITRQNAQEIPSSSFFIERALSIALSTNSSSNAAAPTVHRVHPGRDPLANWPIADVFVLDHPGSLTTESSQFLASQLRRGKGLMYVTSELVDAVNLKQLQELLGSDFQPPVDFVPDKGGLDRRDLFVQRANSRDVPFSILGSNNAASLLNPVRFAGGLSTRATAEGLKDQVVAELNDTSSLLYLTSVGAGQIAVLNTDLAKSNWVVQSTFLPVLGELAQALLASRLQRDQAGSGEPIVRILPAEVTDVNNMVGKTIEGTPPNDGNFGKWDWVAGQNAVVWSWNEPPGPGIYSLEQNTTPQWMLATSAPALESDLSSLSEAVLTKRVSGSRKVGFASNDQQSKNSDDVWKWLIIGCLFGLVAEIGALRWARM